MVEAFLIVLAILVAFGSIAVGRSVRAGWDVVIEVEDVAGVVVILDRGEPWHLAGAGPSRLSSTPVTRQSGWKSMMAARKRCPVSARLTSWGESDY